MKVRARMRAAGLWLLNTALLVGLWPGQAYAESLAATEQIYSWPTISAKLAGPKEIVTKGVTYQKLRFETKSGPITLHETWVDLKEPNVQVKTVLANDKLESEKNETVTAMARRTGAVVGINGDFYESTGSGMALGMAVSEGKLIHHPTQSVVLGIDRQNQVSIEKYSFNGAVTAADGASMPLAALNGHPVSYPEGLVLITPELGFWETTLNATIVTLAKTERAGAWKVTELTPLQNVVENPDPGTVRLVAQGQSGLDYVTAHLKKDDVVTLDYKTNPDSSHLKYAIGGGAMLLKNGQAIDDPHSQYANKNERGPMTAVGVTADGQKMLQLVVDGRTKDSIGLNFGQVTNYFAALGIPNAMSLDGGGSSVMTVRQPGQTQATAANQPSDGRERAVANGLFVYSTLPPGQPTHVSVNGGQNFSVFKGSSFTIKKPFVRDENYNPLPNVPFTLSVEPKELGSITADGVFYAGDVPGTGKVIATSANGLRGEVTVTVNETLDELVVSPKSSDLGNGETIRFSANGRVYGFEVGLKPEYLHWSVNDPSLGTITPDGVFTAAANKQGTATVTVKMSSYTATATIGIGYVKKPLDKLDGSRPWVLSKRWGDVGALTTTTDVVQGGNTASLTANYRFPAGAGAKQFVFYPQDTRLLPQTGDRALVNPVGVGLWVHGDRSNLKLIAHFTNPDETVNYPSPSAFKIDWTGWKYVTFKFPAGVQFPVKFSYLDLVADSPTQPLAGQVRFSGLETLYSIRNYQEKPPEPTVVTFPDIQNHWGRTIIETLATKQIIFGKTAAAFAPADGLTRAEAVALIVRATGLPAKETTRFSDVLPGEWYAGPVGAAVEAGIVNGVGGNAFAPNAPVDRNQAAVMIYNALKYKQKAPTGGTPIAFKDGAQVATWARPSVNALSAAGLLNGNGDGTLSPTKVTSRAEAAVMIHNLMKTAGLL